MLENFCIEQTSNIFKTEIVLKNTLVQIVDYAKSEISKEFYEVAWETWNNLKKP